MSSYPSPLGDPDDGGPDQQCAEIVGNAGSLRSAQIGSIIPGDLLRWRIFKGGLPVDFEVHPKPGGSLPVYDKPPIKGLNGRTKYMQVKAPEGANCEYGFTIKIGGKPVGDGEVFLHLRRPRKAKRRGKS